LEESPLAGAALADHLVDHCERRDRERSAEAKARGHGGWRAGDAAGGPAVSRRAAEQAGRAFKERSLGCGARVQSRHRAPRRPAPLRSGASAHGRVRARALLAAGLVMQRE
jgi:hypothetical protein